MSEPKRKPDDRILTAELFAQVLVGHPFLKNLKVGPSPERQDFCRLLYAVKDGLEDYVESFFMEGYRRG
jgi:hypothetical protein